jgi:hypothetical protein
VFILLLDLVIETADIVLGVSAVTFNDDVSWSTKYWVLDAVSNNSDWITKNELGFVETGLTPPSFMVTVICYPANV